MPIMHAGSYQEDKSGKEQNRVEFYAPRPAIRSKRTMMGTGHNF